MNLSINHNNFQNQKNKMQIVRLLFLILISLSSCDKIQQNQNSNSQSYIKYQFKGKSYEIKNAALIPTIGIPGVTTTIKSEQISVVNTNISGVYSTLGLYGLSKDHELTIGATKSGSPTGDYTYKAAGTIFSFTIYAGLMYDFTTVAGKNTDQLFGTFYGDPKIFTDYSDGGKIYTAISSQSTITVLEAKDNIISGSFDIALKYGTTTQKLTGTFRYSK
jgi:hypothetical protein